MLKRVLLMINVFIWSYILTSVIVTYAGIFKVEIVNEELAPYTNEFLSKLKDTCGDSVKYKIATRGYIIEITDEPLRSDDDKKGQVIGLCTPSFKGPFMVQIDKKFWAEANNESRRQLVMHELSHCFLNLEHIENPNHYMNPYFIKVSPKMLDSQLDSEIKAYCK